MHDETAEYVNVALIGPSSMGQGGSVADYGQPKAAFTAPGGPGAFDRPDGAHGTGSIPEMARGTAVPDPMPLNEPIRSGEVASPVNAGFRPDAWDPPGNFPEPPPKVQPPQVPGDLQPSSNPRLVWQET
jgi:hypothetical protein